MYKGTLFTVDGDWVTDCKGTTPKDVWERLADLGSRWYFYPFQCFVIKDYGVFTSGNQRIVETCKPFADLKGKNINTVSKFFKDNPEIIKIFG